tara:strand:+ start:826 stop:2118 length:1293 start_codon:yes stop_codon:yes gene_type:complete
MSNPVIKVEGISKMYDLGLVGTGTLSKDINRLVAKMLRKPDPYAKITELNDRTVKSKSNSIWALKDVNFNVKQGEVLGIIGKNGAGKSTLLKLLSRITTPTNGSIKIKGRVASLLEVGTGMHPEMTAKQNIYLNGAMLGMNRKEITSKLDEIVEFAGIAKYIDTPIKRFSSGMQVRLGFAVAAFLEPEILIVDEVLAVGDAEFQKKAIGKMKDVSSGQGRTVLFVSHNMASVKSLCTSAILMSHGTVQEAGPVSQIISSYLNDQTEVAINQFLGDDVQRMGSGQLKFEKISLRDITGEYLDYVECGQNFIMDLYFKTYKDDAFKALHFSINLKDSEDRSVAHTSNIVSNGEEYNNVSYPASGKVSCEFKNFSLQPGSYLIEIYCASYREPLDHILMAGKLVVEHGTFYKTNLLPPHGFSLLENQWAIELD